MAARKLGILKSVNHREQISRSPGSCNKLPGLKRMLIGNLFSSQINKCLIKWAHRLKRFQLPF